MVPSPPLCVLVAEELGLLSAVFLQLGAEEEKEAGGKGGRGKEKRSVTKSCDTHVNIVCMNWVLHLLLAAAC